MINKITFILFILFTLQIQAARIYVNQNVTGGNNDGSSWANSYTELQDAFTNATSGDEIWVATGTYTPDWNGTAHDLVKTSRFLFNKDLSLFGGFNGTETLLSDRNWKTNVTRISGDLNNDDIVTFPTFTNVSDNTEQIIQVNGGFNDSVIDGFEILGANGIPVNKQAIHLIGNITFKNTKIYNNQGVAIVEEPAGRSLFENCLFYNNYNNFHGTIFTHDIGTQLINCTVAYNHGDTLSGFHSGGYMVGSVLQNSIFWGNTATNTTYNTEQINCLSASGAANAIASFENNIVENFSGTQWQMTSNTNLATDPLFTNVSNKNFAILETSPGKDAGNNTYSSLNLDLNLDTRIENGTIDIGSYETITTLSVDEFYFNSIESYPNPVKNTVWLKIPESNNPTRIYYNLYDIVGKKIRVNKTLNSNQTINLENLQNGIYLLTIYSNESNIQKTLKLIKN